mmetsp:Transcript_1244/g.2894  ORF Transcript_1244/g.2894 Transcript_1244/m.2894 type:complete len:298 (+) Transcript_1244:299-1192(+)|eukprot:CAMPEP_0197592394 /NCGR_PEP_ID=MMETSP1326-20131121/15068_1 /TAXON_ID=1155430 /ORGANISM="Genus nov. species nov., Strain RCC2288" /LENGTH=297 /DNA_ID=CAMNT_0043158089 /DNA_START=266 /DNA_END=1159 /DNA_ORIENTATION=-
MAQNDMNRLGVFSYPGSVDVGAEYAQFKDKTPARWGGKQMIPKGSVTGNNPDALIDKTFKRISDGDRYVDPGKHEREYAVAQRKLNITEKAFYPPKPPVKSVGKGSNFGCIGKPFANSNEEEKAQPKGPPEPRGMFTNPTKKGGFGVPGTTIGKPIESMPEPYLVSRELEKVERKDARSRIPKAFNYSATPGLFDTNNVFAYEPGAWAEPEKKRGGDESKPKPFKPAAKGRPMHVPEYIPDPLDEKERICREQFKKERDAIPMVFKPPSGQKSRPVVDINPMVPTGPPPVSLRDTIY